MKWETVTSTIGQSVFTLWSNGKKLVTLAFNPSSSAARVESNNEKRVFLIRQEGLLRNRTVLTNEYGVRLGHTGSIGMDHFVEFNKERYFYSVDGAEKSIRIYKDVNQEPLAVCELELGTADKSSKKLLNDKTYYSLLMTLCWYLFKPVEQPLLALSPAI